MYIRKKETLYTLMEFTFCCKIKVKKKKEIHLYTYISFFFYKWYNFI